MENKEGIAELIKAYTAAYSEMTNAVRDARNTHFGSRYATLEAVLSAVRPVLSRHGLAVYQAPGKLQVLEPGSYAVSVVSVLAHGASGQTITVETQVPLPQKATTPAVGSAITYARRYALAAICGITQTDDDGEAARSDNEEDLELQIRSTHSRKELLALKSRVRDTGSDALKHSWLARAKQIGADVTETP